MLAALHRWLALGLAPVFLLILLSGAVLALKPMLAEAPATAAVDARGLAAAVAAADPAGSARALSLSADGSFTLKSPDAAVAGRYGADGTRLAPAGFDLFDFALRLHKDLLVGAGFVVEAAAYAMVALIAAGLFLGWPRLRNTLLGWHMGLGWFALPLVLLAPLTGVLMALHVGTPRLPAIEPGPPLSIARALELAADDLGTHALASARSFRRGSVLLQAVGAAGPRAYLVSPRGSVAALAEGPGLVKALHEGTWAGAASGFVNLLSALVLTGLLGTGVFAWWRRRRQSARRPDAAGATTLVAFASQTGTAARLAEATAQALRRAGEAAACASLAALQPRELAGFRNTLLIVSTTGDGEVPEQARGFLGRVAGADLAGVRFSLLALGDSRYKRFCGGGRRLRQALLERGATEAVDWVRADGEPAAAWRAWLARVGQALGRPLQPALAPAGDRALSLTLRRRERLDDPAQPDLTEIWRLEFEPAEAVAFRPGDLLLVSPGEGEPPRCYSVGSSSRLGDRRIVLTVALHQWQDAAGARHLGRTSQRLCRQLQAGDTLRAALRPHPGFNPPEDEGRPLILVAAGAGIAPFPGFLAERAGRAGAGPVWMIFGNRRREGDYLYRGELARRQAEGTLARLDTAFSRDPRDGAYIQDRIRENGAEILDWLLRRRALLYTCGRASTVGAQVEAALLELVARYGGGLDPQATLERWKAEGTLRVDAFG